MIRCNLAILLAERNLRITKVSKDTGISRTTLTSLSSNKAQGIQFDTINTLCNYLNIEPNQLIIHSPIDIKLKEIKITEMIINNSSSNSSFPSLLDLTLEITKKGRSFNCCTSGAIYITSSTEEIYNENTETYDKILSISLLEIFIDLFDENDNSDIEEVAIENSLLIESFKSLPISFVNDLKNEIINEIITEISLQSDTDFKEAFNIQYDVYFYWDERLIK